MYILHIYIYIYIYIYDYGAPAWALWADTSPDMQRSPRKLCTVSEAYMIKWPGTLPGGALWGNINQNRNQRYNDAHQHNSKQNYESNDVQKWSKIESKIKSNTSSIYSNRGCGAAKVVPPPLFGYVRVVFDFLFHVIVDYVWSSFCPSCHFWIILCASLSFWLWCVFFCNIIK